MYRPTIYRNGLFDDFFTLSFPRSFQEKFESGERQGLMKTDIYEKEKSYGLAIELPGYDKNDIEISLEKGNLTVTASRKDVKEEAGDFSFIRRERFYGEETRSFHIGEDVTEKEIHASFENGVLYLEFPKEVEKEKETKKLITID